MSAWSCDDLLNESHGTWNPVTMLTSLWSISSWYFSQSLKSCAGVWFFFCLPIDHWPILLNIHSLFLFLMKIEILRQFIKRKREELIGVIWGVSMRLWISFSLSQYWLKNWSVGRRLKKCFPEQKGEFTLKVRLKKNHLTSYHSTFFFSSNNEIWGLQIKPVSLNEFTASVLLLENIEKSLDVFWCNLSFVLIQLLPPPS